MPKKSQKKIFVCEINVFEFICVKLSPLRREYLPLALSAFGNSLEILHITHRDIMQVNCLYSGQ